MRSTDLDHLFLELASNVARARDRNAEMRSCLTQLQAWRRACSNDGERAELDQLAAEVEEFLAAEVLA
jgi:hypothetical protein